jgi:ABC-type transport system involved in cytochrome c biogenesis permease subunit
MAPLGLLLVVLAVVFSSTESPDSVNHAYWLTLHRTLSSVSFGAFVLVFAAGVMYLLQERQLKLKQFDGWYRRLPALSILDDVNRAGLIFGVPIITIGMIAASVWSQQNYETMMKTNFSTVALFSGWALFTLTLAGRYAFGWRGRRTAAMAVAAFVVTVGSLIVHLG